MAEIDLPGFEVGAIVERLANIKELIEKLDNSVSATHEQFVPRKEWDVWTTSRDREISKIHDSVDKLTTAIAAEAKARQAEANARRIPWTAVGSFLVAGAALLISLIQTLGG